MRITPVTNIYLRQYAEYNSNIQSSSTRTNSPPITSSNKVSNDVYLNALQAYFITFGAFANSGELKKLFSYGIPCMYSGITMIDASKIHKLAKNGHFSGPISRISEALSPYEKSMMPIEQRLFGYLKKAANIEPNKTFPEIMKELEPGHLKKLRSKQAVTFYHLQELSKEFPPEQLEQFSLLMQNTDKKLQNVPVKVPFSSFEFRYKLDKIYENTLVGGSRPEIRTMKRLIQYASKMRDTTNFKTRNHQGHILRQIKSRLEKSPLRKNNELNELIETSNYRIYNFPIKIPFNRKSFLYDLQKITSEINNPTLAEKVNKTAQQLPTSRNDISAFILKFQDSPSERLCCRLVSDSYGSIEHLLPQSKGGKDELANYGPATTYYNSLRSNTEFKDHINAHPEIKINCQKCVDEMIKLANNGVFEKIRLPRQYILWFKDTVAKLSDNDLILNTDNLQLLKK